MKSHAAGSSDGVIGHDRMHAMPPRAMLSIFFFIHQY